MIDNNLLLYIAIFIMIVAIIIFIVLKNVKGKQSFKKLPFPIESLVTSLGGRDNIVNASSTISKISIELNDNDLVLLDEIKKLGASGIVEKSTGFTFIFGSISPLIIEVLDDYLKA